MDAENLVEAEKLIEAVKSFCCLWDVSSKSSKIWEPGKMPGKKFPPK